VEIGSWPCADFHGIFFRRKILEREISNRTVTEPPLCPARRTSVLLACATALIGTLSITGKAYGLIIDSTGTAYVGAEQTNHDAFIYKVNPTTAAVTLVGDLAITEGINSISAVPEPCSALLPLTYRMILTLRHRKR
jgi:hypothetical protein